MITDAQVHLYDPDTPERPWPRESWRPNPQVKSFTAADMIAEMDAIGVDRAVIVPPAWAGDENGNLTAVEAAERYPGRFAIMRAFDPYAADAQERIQGWRDQPHMLGIRMTWVSWDNDPPTLLVQLLEEGGGQDLEWYWAACEEQRIPIMFYTAERAKALEPVIAAHPGLPVIFDHMAARHADSVEESYVALDDLVRMAKYPNAHVKVSDAPNHSHEPYPFSDVHPVIRRLIEAYGPQRLMWGTDLSQLMPKGIPYADALRLWQEGLGLSEEEKEWILGRTVAEVLRWPES